jgi:hypothetical protein
VSVGPSGRLDDGPTLTCCWKSSSEVFHSLLPILFSRFSMSTALDMTILRMNSRSLHDVEIARLLIFFLPLAFHGMNLFWRSACRSRIRLYTPIWRAFMAFMATAECFEIHRGCGREICSRQRPMSAMNIWNTLKRCERTETADLTGSSFREYLSK